MPKLQLSPPNKLQRKCYLLLFKRAFSIITNKDYLTKENVRIKKMLKENGNHESIISKIFKRITNNHSLSQTSLFPLEYHRYSRGKYQNEYKFTVRSRC